MIAGSLVMHHPSGASAARRVTCSQAVALADLWTSYANLMAAYDRPIEMVAGSVRADSYAKVCNSWT
jgi:hypothetical protein